MSESGRGPAVGLRKLLAGTCNLDLSSLRLNLDLGSQGHDSVATLSQTQGIAQVTSESTTQHGDSGVGGSQTPISNAVIHVYCPLGSIVIPRFVSVKHIG